MLLLSPTNSHSKGHLSLSERRRARRQITLLNQIFAPNSAEVLSIAEKMIKVQKSLYLFTIRIISFRQWSFSPNKSLTDLHTNSKESICNEKYNVFFSVNILPEQGKKRFKKNLCNFSGKRRVFS